MPGRCRSGTPTSSPAVRSWPTPSRRCSVRYNLPAYVLPFWTALGWIAVLKLWVAAFGMFLLARALGMRFGGALLAGLVFALSL